MSKRAWSLRYVNSQQWIGRFNGYWTRGNDIDCAAIYSTEAEAEQAIQALLQEGTDRLRDDRPASRFWSEICGGIVEAVPVEILMREIPLAEAAVDPQVPRQR